MYAIRHRRNRRYLYVGCTSDPTAREAVHQMRYRKRGWETVMEVFSVHDTRAEGLVAEAELIRDLAAAGHTLDNIERPDPIVIASRMARASAGAAQ